MNPNELSSAAGVQIWRTMVGPGTRVCACEHLPQFRVDLVPAALGDDAPLWAARGPCGKGGGGEMKLLISSNCFCRSEIAAKERLEPLHTETDEMILSLLPSRPERKAGQNRNEFCSSSLSFIPPPFTDPHRRYNPLTGEWILVSPHRTQRPWLGQVEKPSAESRPQYDPHCYLCQGMNAPAATAIHNTMGRSSSTTTMLRCFLTSILHLPPSLAVEGWRVAPRRERTRLCRVICFSPVTIGRC